MQALHHYFDGESETSVNTMDILSNEILYHYSVVICVNNVIVGHVMHFV